MQESNACQTSSPHETNQTPHREVKNRLFDLQVCGAGSLLVTTSSPHTLDRIRHVKCDETQPHCRRCTSTGRRCEGPIVQEFRFVQDSLFEARSRPKSPLNHPVLPLSRFEDNEKHAFDFFLQQAAPMLSGPLDAHFWAHLIPQLSLSEPVIRNAVLAISCLYGKHQFSASPTVVDPQHQQALKWYNTAITRFKLSIQQNAEDPSIALLSCILFICIEVQQGHGFNAMALLQTGIQLLSSTTAATYNKNLPKPSSAVVDAVTPFFLRYTVFAATFGVQAPPEWSSQIENMMAESDFYSFSSLQDARSTLYILMYQSHALIRRAVVLRSQDPDAINDLTPRQALLLTMLTEWHSVFSTFRLTSPTLSTTTASSTLLMYHTVTYIWLATCLSPYQTTFDSHNSRFAQIIHHAEIALGINVDDAQQQAPFTMEMGVIQPLYFVATKCRHPLIRRKALALLRTEAPKKESMWNSHPTADFVEKIIEMEEAGLNIPTLSSSSTSPPTSEFPIVAENMRLRHLEVIQSAVPRSSSVPQTSFRTGRYFSDTNDTSHRLEEQVVITKQPTEWKVQVRSPS